MAEPTQKTRRDNRTKINNRQTHKQNIKHPSDISIFSLDGLHDDVAKTYGPNTGPQRSMHSASATVTDSKSVKGRRGRSTRQARRREVPMVMKL